MMTTSNKLVPPPATRTSPLKETLVFEGVGSETDNANGISSRMRTRLKSPTHGTVYLEIMAAYKGKYASKAIQNSPYAYHGTVVHATHENDDTAYNKRVLRDIVNDSFLYTEKGIVEYVNRVFGARFESLVVNYALEVHGTKDCLC